MISSWTNKPGSVPALLPVLSFIWDEIHISPPSTYPSGCSRRNWNEQLQTWPIWSFNTWGLPDVHVATHIRGLLPHVFTLILQAGRYSFLWHFLLPKPIGLNTFPLGSRLLCVARTFLSSASGKATVLFTTKSSFSYGKGTNLTPHFQVDARIFKTLKITCKTHRVINAH